MKVTLVYLGALGAAHTHPRHLIPPLRTGYAAAVLRARGHDVELIDTAAPPRLDDDALRARVARRRPDVLVLDPRIETVRHAADLAARLAPHAGAVVCAGPPAESARRELLAARGGPLAGVLGGEYEGAIGALVDALAAGRDGADVPGFARPGPLGPREGPPVAPIADLDALPWPPHEQFVNGGYQIGYPVQQRGRVRAAYVLSTRGCPHACTFCSPVEMRSRFLPYRLRDVRDVVEELAHVERLGANTVYFNDDNFLREGARVAALCEAIITRGLTLRWLADCRADDVDPALLPLMRRAGCSTLCLGVESGSQRVLDSLRKGLKVEHVFRAAAAIRAAGLWTVMYVILGAPGETHEDRLATFRLVTALRPEMVQCHRFARYPMARGERGDAGAWRRAGDKFVGADGAGAAPLEFDQRDLYMRYYLSPRFLLDYVRTRGPYLPGPVLNDGALALRTLSFLFERP